MSKLNFGFFQEYIQSFDIICISDTKNKTILTDEIYGYKFINNRTGGIYGISILVKDNLYNDIKYLDELQSENVLWISIISISKTSANSFFDRSCCVCCSNIVECP